MSRTHEGGSTGSPFVDKNRLQTFLKDPLLKEHKNYSTWAETSYE